MPRLSDLQDGVQTFFIHWHLNGDVREVVIDGLVRAWLDRRVVLGISVELRDGADAHGDVLHYLNCKELFVRDVVSAGELNGSKRVVHTSEMQKNSGRRAQSASRMKLPSSWTSVRRMLTPLPMKTGAILSYGRAPSNQREGRALTDTQSRSQTVIDRREQHGPPGLRACLDIRVSVHRVRL